MLETIFVTAVFLLYLLLWSVKRAQLIRKDNIDPQVIGKSESNLQKYMYALTRVLMGYIALLIPLHGLNISLWGLFDRFDRLNGIMYDFLGLTAALAGLLLCLYAQIKMGRSWRVGIDMEKKTELITTGLYSLIRNPTYLGLFGVCLGVWLIWPTVTIAVFALLFTLFLEIQVRCEEDFLENAFGDEYRSYKKRTKRYFPFIY